MRVYGTPWQLLADALRLKAAGAPFRIINPSSALMQAWATYAIDLHAENFTPSIPFGLDAFKS